MKVLNGEMKERNERNEKMRHGSHVVNKSKTHLKLRMMENFNKEMITLKKSKRKFKKKM